MFRLSSVALHLPLNRFGSAKVVKNLQRRFISLPYSQAQNTGRIARISSHRMKVLPQQSSLLVCCALHVVIRDGQRGASAFSTSTSSSARGMPPLTTSMDEHMTLAKKAMVMSYPNNAELFGPYYLHHLLCSFFLQVLFRQLARPVPLRPNFY